MLIETTPTQVARREDEVETTEAVEQDRRPWWVRVRSAVVLALLVVGLGVAAAAVWGLAALAVAAIFDQALG